MKNHLLPDIDFTASLLREITIKVDQVKGINLGQGVCLLPIPETVRDAAVKAITGGQNRYTPARGISRLRELLAARLNRFNSIPCNRDHIIITDGSTGAFEVVCSAFLGKGDEIILFAPFYPYHRRVPERKGASVKTVALYAPDWSFDFAELEKAVTEKTRFVLLCNPANPTGKVFTRQEMEKVAELCVKHDICCITDEVYEYMTYDGRRHLSMASLPGMFERTLTMGSYSKTFAVTGWRVGYLCVPSSVIGELNCINDQVYVCSPTPFQHAVADGIEFLEEEYYLNLLEEYRRKRELMREALESAGLVSVVPQGAYYMLARTGSRFPGLSSEEVLDVMISKTGVGAIPAGEFLGPGAGGDPEKSDFLRFSYSVPDETLVEAGERLKTL
jgi:aminotransferase